MKKECLELIKKIGRNDLIIGGVLTLMLIPFFRGGAGLFILGIVCSFINFIINSYANTKIGRGNTIFDGLLFVALYAVRILIICSISIVLIIKGELLFFIFIAGYSSQFLSIILYGFDLKIREGV